MSWSVVLSWVCSKGADWGKINVMLLDLNVDLGSIILAGFAVAWVASAIGDAIRFMAGTMGNKGDDIGM